MRKPVHEFMKFENIKDMLQKTGEKYGQRPAYKFKTEKPNELKIITHKEFSIFSNSRRNWCCSSS